MLRSHPRLRIVLFVLVAVAVSVGGAWAALRYYLSTAGAREIVAAKLETAFGTDVHVGELAVGWNSSAVQLEIFEAASPGEPPRTLVTVKSAQVDVSIAELVRGTTPDRFTLNGAHLRLRFDKDGNLLTRLPQAQSSSGEMPGISLRDAVVTVAQEGRPEFRLSGINAEMRPDQGVLNLEGQIRDGNWGEWSAEAKWNLAAGTGSAMLRSARARMTRDGLRSLPLVPDNVSNQIQVQGVSTVQASIEKATAEGPVRTRIELEPQRATVVVAALDMTVEDVMGRIVIEDAVVDVESLQARAAGGDVVLRGRLDFAATPSVLKFQVAARGLDLRQLPASWSMPPQLEGRLKGQANLELTIDDGKFETSGEGRGEVEEARLAGIPAERVELRLHSDGRRFRFANDPAGGVALPPVAAFLIAATTLIQPPAPSAAIDLSFNFKDADLGELVQKLKLDLPFRVGGRITLVARARLPLDRVSDLKAYQFSGRISSSSLRLEDLEIVDMAADLKYLDGILTLENLTGKLRGDQPAGRIAGGARVELVPQNDLTAQLSLMQINLGAIVRTFGLDDKNGRGPISGQVDFRVPLARLTDPASWTATGELKADRLVLYERELRGVRAVVQARDGAARLTEAKLRVEGIDLTATGQVELAKNRAFSATVEATPAEVTDFGKLLAEFRLPISIAGRLEGSAAVRGTLTPWTIEAAGRAGAASLRIDRARIERVGFDWKVQPGRIVVSDFRAAVYDGTATGSAELPTSAAASGMAELRLERIDSAPMSRDWALLPVRVDGRVNGSLKAKLSAEANDQPRRMSADLELEAPRLRIADVLTRRVKAAVRYRPESLEYDLVGEPLGGRLTMKGTAPLIAGGAGSGRVHLERADLWYMLRNDTEHWRGQIDLDLNYRDQNGELHGQGRIDLVDFGIGDDVLSERLGADLRIEGPVLFIAGPTGSVAGGQLRGRARYDLSGRERGFISLNAYGVDASRILAPYPNLSRQVGATVDGQLRGSLGREWTGTGHVSFARGRFFGLSLTSGRAPFEWAMAPGSRGELKFRDLSAQGGNGRISGSTEYAWGLENRLDGKLRFSGIDLRAVLLETVAFGKIGAGRADGRFDFRSDNLRDFDDLTGTLALGFSQTSALELPVLRPLAPYLATGQALTGFHRGDLLAYLSRGVFRIQRMTLEAPSSRVYAEGSVTTEGRLDLQVNAMTGQIGANPDMVGLAGLRLPTVGPIPVVMLVRISNSLSNRVVRLRVGGTLANPTIQVNAAALLSEGVVRYLLSTSSIPLP